ncbi:MAG: DedA family protein [Gemmatimonadaceae bacterium]
MLQTLDWLSSLPVALLYLVIGAAALVENIFPPVPADTAIALGAFVAARGPGTAFGVWSATMVGNIGGAMLMYYVGYRFGLPWLEKKIPALHAASGADEFQKRYQRFGIPGLALSRFLPGVRGVVPPVAGAMRIGAIRALLAMGIASGVWYGLVCVVAFRAGANAEVVLAAISKSQRAVGVGAVVVVLIAVGVWWMRRKRSANNDFK